MAINSSVSGEGSVSRALIDDAVKRLSESSDEAAVTYRDLSSGHVPLLTTDTVAGVSGVAATAAERTTQALSDELISELQVADVVVIGAPMHNFGIPSSLRTWFDHVLRPCVTFAYNEGGPRGLLTGKHAIVIESRSGLYSRGNNNVIDFQESNLKQLLSLIGIAGTSFVRAVKTGGGPEDRDLAISEAKPQVAAAVARITNGTGTPKLDASAQSQAPRSIDYNAIMQGNLRRVFGERDPSRRVQAIRELYDKNAVLHEPQASVQGHDAISQAVTELLERLPSGFVFKPIRPALGHNGLGRLQWWSGPPEGPAAVTGIDVAHIEDNLIRSLHVFLDQSAPEQ
ncbi:NAD(P)H-dependent oxidoreductase [Bradyrhizobium tunisiense]|uniref:NAD(P)H-dependent oxidoreductase n=1 Tax=Bradyrhizobium tunisiense TaxID=3278709 RepID=UPI0035D9384F